jgi:hypothetical protein
VASQLAYFDSKLRRQVPPDPCWERGRFFQLLFFRSGSPCSLSYRVLQILKVLV